MSVCMRMLLDVLYFVVSGKKCTCEAFKLKQAFVYVAL